MTDPTGDVPQLSPLLLYVTRLDKGNVVVKRALDLIVAADEFAKKYQKHDEPTLDLLPYDHVRVDGRNGVSIAPTPDDSLRTTLEVGSAGLFAAGAGLGAIHSTKAYGPDIGLAEVAETLNAHPTVGLVGVLAPAVVAAGVAGMRARRRWTRNRTELDIEAKRADLRALRATFFLSVIENVPPLQGETRQDLAYSIVFLIREDRAAGIVFEVETDSPGVAGRAKPPPTSPGLD